MAGKAQDCSPFGHSPMSIISETTVNIHPIGNGRGTRDQVKPPNHVLSLYLLHLSAAIPLAKAHSDKF